ncbi:MAG: electron transfer flavoprotein subunit alpha/FixB family protein, partial [Clostridia bacterium]
GKIENVAYELLGAATALKTVSGETVTAMLCGYNIKDKASELIAMGADKVLIVEDECLKLYTTEPYAQAVASIIWKYNPNTVLFPATVIGRDLAPRLSARIHTGLTADCTKLETNENGELFMTRPAFGGNLFATIICPDSRPQMSTVRPGVMQKLKCDNNRTGEIECVSVEFNKELFLVEVLDEVKEIATESTIENAKIIVSVGRGMKTNIALAQELATALKGTLGCSRALVDEGVVAQSKQVGQTGKTVRPELYIALGISGAVQHLAGMENSDFIIAVNKDKDANIMNIAQLGVAADAKAFTEALLKEIKLRDN